jgi:hypothetical protein
MTHNSPQIKQTVSPHKNKHNGIITCTIPHCEREGKPSLTLDFAAITVISRLVVVASRGRSSACAAGSTRTSNAGGCVCLFCFEARLDFGAILLDCETNDNKETKNKTKYKTGHTETTENYKATPR